MGDLSFKLELDERSVNQASKKLNQPVKGAGTVQATPGRKGVGVGAAVGLGAIGGLVGSLIGSLDSINGLLKAILAPINALVSMFLPVLLQLLKPFLVLFLLVGGLLLKMLRGRTGDEDVFSLDTLAKVLGGILGTILGGLIGGLPGAIAGAIGGAALGGAMGPTKEEEDALFKTGQEHRKAIIEFLERIGKDLSEFWNNVKSFFDSITWEKIEEIWNVATKDLEKFWADVVETFSSMWKWLNENLSKSIEILTELGDWIWKELVAIFTSALNRILEFGNWLWNILTSNSESSLDVIKNFGQWLWDTLISKISSGLNVLRNIGDDISDRIEKLLGKAKSKAGRYIPFINDGIVKPNGQVIRTNPNDTIFAMRNPDSLLGGGRQAPVININITGVITDEVISELQKKLSQTIRTGGYF